MAHQSLNTTSLKSTAPASQAFDKIWLPRALYEAVPYFYLLGGIAALFATLYINNSASDVPLWIVFAALCLHAGSRILWMRFQYRRSAIGIDNIASDEQKA